MEKIEKISGGVCNDKTRSPLNGRIEITIHLYTVKMLYRRMKKNSDEKYSFEKYTAVVVYMVFSFFFPSEIQAHNHWRVISYI